MKFIIIPGNGVGNILLSRYWYGWLANELRILYPQSEVICKNFPDPYVAKESVWIPFLKDVLLVDDQTIIIGHSSGACCCMRLLEHTRVLGCILVAAAYTDLGDENERASGYFNREWSWNNIRSNAQFIHQFHSIDDSLIPVAEARHISEQLYQQVPVGDNVYEYTELDGRNHFFEPFLEIIEVLSKYFPNSRS